MYSGRPRSLTLAAVAVLVEAAAAVVLGLAEAFSVQVARLVVGVGAALVLVLYGVLLAAVARGLLRVRRWARGPTVATQLIQLPVAWSFTGGSTTWVAVLLIGLAVVVLVAVLSPGSTAVLTGGRED